MLRRDKGGVSDPSFLYIYQADSSMICLFRQGVVGYENYVTRPTYKTRLQEVQASQLLDSQEQEACRAQD